MRILFMGTPDFAVRILESLADTEDVAAVFTQPGKPKGRGHSVTASPVEQAASARGIPCHTPPTLRDGAAAELLEKIDPELIVVVAYGKILPQYVLDYPKFGAVNVHASLLPRWRGAAPIQRAIMAGDTKTGVTTMMMDAGLDTGDMLVRETVEILPDDDFGSLHDKLADAGVKAISETLRRIRNGTLERYPQPQDGVTYASKIEKTDAVIDFSRSAEEIVLQIRAMSPVPAAVTRLHGKQLKIVSAARACSLSDGAQNGEILSADGTGMTVACGDGAVKILEVIPEGKRRMSSAEFARGHRDLAGEVLSWE